LASLTFGSLISATDPVTVLAVFQAIGVKVDLFSMVFGESVLNDAVAIVLSRTLLSFNEPGTTVNQESILAACQLFAIIFVGSMIIGTVAGLISSLVFKVLDLKHHDEMLYMEAALSFAFPWCAYFVAEASELSGIVAILACGMVMATYTRLNFSPPAIRLTARAYKCIALVAETFVFVYLGMACITFPIFESTVWQFFFWATLACFVGRLHIYVGSWMTNWFRGPTSSPPPISSAYQFVMWFSGLRGGVAFALASVSYSASDFPTVCGGIQGPDAEELKRLNSHCNTGHYDSLAVLQATMLIAVFTIFALGGSITTVAIAFDVLEKKGGAAEEGESERSVDSMKRRNSVWSVEASHNFLLSLLTNEPAYPKETGARFDVEDEAEGHQSDVEAQMKEFKDKMMQPRELGKGWTTLLMKQNMSAQQLHMVLAPPNSARASHDSEPELSCFALPHPAERPSLLLRLRSPQPSPRRKVPPEVGSLPDSPAPFRQAFGSPAIARRKTKEDQVDELRSLLPGLSTKQLEKALDDAAGDVKAAATAQGAAGGLKEML
jgi:sodium/hydrogen exchanger 8